MPLLYHFLKIEKLTASLSAPSVFLSLKHPALFLTEGTGYCYRNQQSAPPFDKIGLFYGAAGSDLEFRAGDASSLKLYVITFSVVKVDTGQGEEELRGKFSLEENSYTIADAERIKPKVIELNNKFHENQGSMFFKLQAMFHELLHELICEEEERNNQSSDSLIELSIAYMQKHYMLPITRQQLADRSSVSAGYFSRLFRKETGQSFSEYLSVLRIDKAKEQLLTSRTSLHQIAACVGYRDGFYLSRKFKQVVGIAPTIYVKKPKKFVSLAPNYTACMLALDVQPYMASMTPWIAQQFQLASHVYDGSRIDWYNADRDERLRQAKPDIIICYEENEEELAGIKRIALTVPISWRQTSWREQFLRIADLVDKLPKAEAWLSRYDERVEGRKQQMRGIIERGETVTIIGVGPRNLYVFGNRWGRGGHVIYDSLGLVAPDQVKRSLHSGEGCKAITLEELPQYAGDHLFLTTFRTVGRPLVCNKRLVDSVIWKGLDAVKKNRAYEVDAGAFYGFDPVSTDVQLDIVVNRLLSTST